ncbi:hypothetical protein MVEN_00156300 [Mycena venus]|uniref:Uncharacterized protein n=1 Tax=Mycena venus TaxID=2733690 RepID=A0A8H6Z0F5_9AGAR|nr:hypothetical protein MVEN_00156300 [Mycena venus]
MTILTLVLNNANWSATRTVTMKKRWLPRNRSENARIRRLVQGQGPKPVTKYSRQAQNPTRKAALRAPPVRSRTSDGAPPEEPLLAWLKNIMGFDLSKHLALFKARGFENVDTLRRMAKWEKRHLQETLRRVLTGSEAELCSMRGLMELELVSLEIAIRVLK